MADRSYRTADPYRDLDVIGAVLAPLA